MAQSTHLIHISFLLPSGEFFVLNCKGSVSLLFHACFYLTQFQNCRRIYSINSITSALMILSLLEETAQASETRRGDSLTAGSVLLENKPERGSWATETNDAPSFRGRMGLPTSASSAVAAVQRKQGAWLGFVARSGGAGRLSGAKQGRFLSTPARL